MVSSACKTAGKKKKSESCKKMDSAEASMRAGVRSPQALCACPITGHVAVIPAGLKL